MPPDFSLPFSRYRRAIEQRQPDDWRGWRAILDTVMSEIALDGRELRAAETGQHVAGALQRAGAAGVMWGDLQRWGLNRRITSAALGLAVDDLVTRGLARVEATGDGERGRPGRRVYWTGPCIAAGVRGDSPEQLVARVIRRRCIITHRDLTRATQKLKAPERREAIEALLAAGVITTTQTRSGAAGPTTSTYMLAPAS